MPLVSAGLNDFHVAGERCSIETSTGVQQHRLDNAVAGQPRHRSDRARIVGFRKDDSALTAGRALKDLIEDLHRPMV